MANKSVLNDDFFNDWAKGGSDGDDGLGVLYELGGAPRSKPISLFRTKTKQKKSKKKQKEAFDGAKK